MIAALDSIDAKVKALVSATTRIPGAGKMSAARKESIADYEESQRLVVDVARKINLAEKEVQRLSDSIGNLMYPSGPFSKAPKICWWPGVLSCCRCCCCIVRG